VRRHPFIVSVVECDPDVAHLTAVTPDDRDRLGHT